MVEDGWALAEQERQVPEPLEDRAIEAEGCSRRWRLEPVAGDHHRAQPLTEPWRRVDAVPEAVERRVHAAKLIDEAVAVRIGGQPH